MTTCTCSTTTCCTASGTHLIGRRMYETMAVWETDPSFAKESAVLADFAAVWQDADVTGQAEVWMVRDLPEVPIRIGEVAGIAAVRRLRR